MKPFTLEQRMTRLEQIVEELRSANGAVIKKDWRKAEPFLKDDELTREFLAECERIRESDGTQTS